MDVCTEWRRKVHDACVLFNIKLYKKVKQGTLLPDWKKAISRVQVINIYTYQICLMCFTCLHLGITGKSR